MNIIPIDQLQNKTNTGLQIKFFLPAEKSKNRTESSDAHRDDHYIFFLLTGGSGTLVVESKDITLTAGQLYYILPSQVHRRIQTEHAEGWFLAVDTSLIRPEFRDVFEKPKFYQEPVKLSDYELKQYSGLLILLYEEYIERRNDKYYLPIIHTLVQSFLAMASSTFSAMQSAGNIQARSAELARQFKDLLSAHVHTIKRPSEYASMLNVSLGYLNETIKKVTGSTVSYWIQHEVFSEAKRLLYHSDEDVKQIAYQLGYTDYSYFCRFFRKASGMSPLKFRAINRKL